MNKKIFAFVIFTALMLSFMTSCFFPQTTTDGDDFVPISNSEYKNLLNNVTQTAVAANVRLKVEKRLGSTISTANGSGVIYYSAEETVTSFFGIQSICTYYYCLTNNHVVSLGEGTSVSSIIVSDYEGNEYVGTLVANDPNYDLAVVKFMSESEELKCLEISSRLAEPGEVIAAIGSPGGQINAVTLGEIIATDVKISNDNPSKSNISFDVLKHSAPLREGSSGGVLLDSELKILGINFAVAISSEADALEYGCAVPADKVIEFLQKNNLN